MAFFTVGKQKQRLGAVYWTADFYSQPTSVKASFLVLGLTQGKPHSFPGQPPLLGTVSDPTLPGRLLWCS